MIGYEIMKVMLIDDDTEILKSMSDSLTLNGVENRKFDNPIIALQEYKKEIYDAVILDIKMPVMNGIEVLKSIKEHNPNAYVIIHTGFPELNTAMSALNLGAYAYLKKPSGFKELMSILEKVKAKFEHEPGNDINGLNLNN